MPKSIEIIIDIKPRHFYWFKTYYCMKRRMSLDYLSPMNAENLIEKYSEKIGRYLHEKISYLHHDTKTDKIKIDATVYFEREDEEQDIEISCEEFLTEFFPALLVKYENNEKYDEDKVRNELVVLTMKYFDINVKKAIDRNNPRVDAIIHI